MAISSYNTLHTDASQHTHIYTHIYTHYTRYIRFVICGVLTVLQAESRKQRVPLDASQRITRHIHSVCSITHHIYSVCGVYMCACHSTCHNTHTYAHTHIHTTHTIYVVYDTWCVVGAAGGEQKAVHGVQHLTTHTHTHYTHCVCGVL